MAPPLNTTIGVTQPQSTTGAVNIGAPQKANPYNLPPDLVQGMTQSDQLGGLLGQFEGARQDAKTANEQRYQQILGGGGAGGYGQLEADYKARTEGLLGQVGQLGEAQRQPLNQKFEQQGAGLTQDMINRGLYNSTTLDSMRQGLSRQQQQQSLQLEDQLLRQKLDYGARLTGEELANRPQSLQFMERREDVGPSYQDVAGVAGAVGAGMAGSPDYMSGLGMGGTPTGPAAPTGQTPVAGPNPVGPGSSNVPMPSGRPPGGLTSTGGLGTSSTFPVVGGSGGSGTRMPSSGGGGGSGGGTGGGGSGGGSGGSGGGFESGFESTGGYDPFAGETKTGSGSSTGGTGTGSGGTGGQKVLNETESQKLRDFGTWEIDVSDKGGTIPAYAPSGAVIGYWPKAVHDYIQKQAQSNPLAAARIEQEMRKYMLSSAGSGK